MSHLARASGPARPGSQETETVRGTPAPLSYSLDMSVPRRTLIEDLLVEEQRCPRWLTVHPVIADTSALLADLIGNVRYGGPTPLTVAMGIGLLRIYCPQHVWAEMPRKIEEKAEDEHLDGDYNAPRSSCEQRIPRGR
jgi:hypothetical protein